ncbi:MAG: Gfo/Idh/MocA family protein, partial [Acidimicrobiales bacterium]
MRVGFLGAGLIANFHASWLAASGEGIEWSGVFDPDTPRADAFARQRGAPVRASEGEVLDGCDAVYVCTWTSEHARLVGAACERGLPVFCEKPLSTTLAGARAMTEAVVGAGVTNQVGLVLRRSPAFCALRDLVGGPESGRVMSILFRDDQFIPVRGAYGSTWRGDVHKAGSGTLLEHSIHDADLLEWLVGPIGSVTARSANFHGIEGIEDAVVATVAYGNGAVGTLTSIWHDVDSRPSLRHVEVFCERAWYCLESEWSGPVRWMRGPGDEGVLVGDALVAAGREARGGDENADAAFIRAVREG